MHNIFNWFQDTDAQQARTVNSYKEFFLDTVKYEIYCAFVG